MRALYLPILPAVLCCGLLSSNAARAEYPDHALYLGLHGGTHIVTSPWDLGEGASLDGLRAASGAYGLGGLQVGYQLSPRFAIEAAGSFAPFGSNADVSNTALDGDLGVLYQLTGGDWAPFVAGGVSDFIAVGSGDLTNDRDPGLHVGVGLRGHFAHWFALRVEAMDILSDGFSGAPANDIQIRVGLDGYLIGKPDQDKDGITDKNDVCPTVAGVESAQGCPDQDGDGVTDSDDACPADVGAADMKGCPDSDGDRVTDRSDECPNDPGPSQYKGCPDKDGDTVIDKSDACPDVKGLASLKGCPDADGDAITDKEDACPNEPGPLSLKGCPDRDHDGVADKDDKCPDVTGLKQFEGCVPDVVKKFTGSIKGINFETGSAKILKSSNATLDKAVAVLNDFPELKLRIEGHTDDVGDDASNMTLSQDRAASVRQYMIEKGIDSRRLVAQGYGETKPIADNKTSKGRAANRRIEFTIIGE